jgi:hypothetical protein
MRRLSTKPKVYEDNAMKKLALMLLLLIAPTVVAQETSTPNEKPVSLTESAIALDTNGSGVLEARLLTTPLNGAPDTPVINTRLVIRNISTTSFTLVSGVVTFYDNAGIRCGEGVFKADVLAPNESFESDTPGVRIRCSASSWRIVATNLIPRFILPSGLSTARLVITIDGDEHPLQLDKPLTIGASNKKRTIVVRAVD